MTARNYRYYQQADFRKGICDQQENLDPKSQVLDARNVWAPLGQCVRRPGYQAIAQYNPDLDWQAADGDATYFDDSLVDSDYPIFYIGADTPFFAIQSFNPDITNTTAEAMHRVEYWNGAAWMPMDSAQAPFGTTNTNPLYCGLNTADLVWSPPQNWALTTVNTFSKYWMRYVWAGFDAPSSTPTGFSISAPLRFLTAAELATSNYFPWGAAVVGLFQFKYNTGSNFLFGYRYAYKATPSTLLLAQNTLTGGDILANGSQTGAYRIQDYQPRPVLQATCIPEFNTAYVCYNNVVYQVTNSNTIAAAAVNSDSLIVGTDPLLDAPYRADLISLLPAFPEAQYVINFRNLIFASGIKNQPTLVRWSGAVNEGAFNVWPETSFEFLSTAKDNSPITAMAGLGDNLVVFKQDSIWQLIFNGLDDLDLPKFIPQLVVAGVGCVSQGSIQEVRGRLIFLAEDGFYAFDGTPNIQKISENVNATTQRINPAHRPFATAVNWRSRYCYLCSVALDESTSNNLIFVYDYKHDAWWLWDDIPAEFMFTTSDTALQEQVIFGNQTAGFFQLGGETDNFGEIDSYVLSGRFGKDESMWKKAREVRVQSENIDGTIQYTLIGDDQSLNASAVDLVMNSSLETAADPPPDDGCDNVQIRRRERKSPRSLTCEWFQLKVEGFRTLDGYLIGYIPQSRR